MLFGTMLFGTVLFGTVLFGTVLFGTGRAFLGERPAGDSPGPAVGHEQPRGHSERLQPLRCCRTPAPGRPC